MTTSFPGKPQ